MDPIMLKDGKSSPKIMLELMQQQVEVRAPEDDWTGRTSTAERKKLQNRLNQRIYREFEFLYIRS
jgi:hypothetical protein